MRARMRQGSQYACLWSIAEKARVKQERGVLMTNEARIPRSFFCFGASAGGIEALIAILDRLPADLDATCAIVVHRSPTAASGLAGIFSRHSAMPVLEPHDGDPVRRGTVYLAPQD